jgi:hypothetical protein
MTTDLLKTKFARIGARMKVNESTHRGWGVRNPSNLVRLDVRTDRHGEFFQIDQPPNSEAGLEILDVQPDDRHLLLMVRDQGAKHKFLCGHDERHWFVAAVPESAPVGTVRAAKEALKPPAVRTAQARLHLRAEIRNRRKNPAFRRQGEWFFVPEPDLVVDPIRVLRDEPIRRGGGKPHWAEFCYRTGGESVHVCSRHRNGLTEAEYRKTIEADPKARSWGWQVMRRDAGVYVRGRISHADHRTITLTCWHQVLMNTENQAQAMRHVAFLD